MDGLLTSPVLPVDGSLTVSVDGSLTMSVDGSLTFSGWLIDIASATNGWFIDGIS